MWIPDPLKRPLGAGALNVLMVLTFLCDPTAASGKGKAVDLSIWHDFIEQYSAFYQKTYGPKIRSRYQLHLRELEEMRAPDYSVCRPPVVARKTLKRWVDGVILEGRTLPALVGRSLDSLRIYVHRDGQWKPIPYQFDEYTPDGFKVLPEGPENNAHKGNGLLDEQDEIVLMAHDTGDRVAKPDWPGEVRDGVEIEVIDPSNQDRGWFYVFSYEGSPPARHPVRYIYADIPVDDPIGYRSFSPYYLIHGKTLHYKGKLYNQIFYDTFFQSPLAGGTGVDYVDRMKWRLRVRFLFGSIKIRFDEDSLTGEFFAWRRGAVRGTYRVWAVANLPLGLKSPRIVADVIQVGENIISTSTLLHVPFNPGYVLTDMSTRIGTDLSAEAKGMRFYNSNNQKGILIDGTPKEAVKKMDRGRDDWRLISGPQGAMMNRSYWSPNFIEQAKSIEVYMVDDVEERDPPEFHDGQVGGVYSEATVRNLKAGDYSIGIEWYFLNNFYDPERLRMEVVEDYLRYQDAPLEVRSGGKTVRNKSQPTAARPWKD